MTNRNTILNELKGLGSTLANHSPQNIYEVPDGYFEGLANHVLNRIRALDAPDAKTELEALSPLLTQVSKEIPYSIPAGYFENLDEKIMQNTREHADYQTADEELASLSPLLSSIDKKSPYAVPEGYFENLGNDVAAKAGTVKKVKVISITTRKWFRYAAAAVVILVGGLIWMNQKNAVDPDQNPYAWVEKKMKKVSTEEINNFISLTNNESVAKKNTNGVSEIREMVKDISDSEIDAFLNETAQVDETVDGSSLFN